MVRHGVSVLALVRVLENTIEHVGKIDENICANHALPKVPRVAHLGHEVEKDHSSTISVDNVVDALVSTKEPATTRGKSSRGAATELSDGLGACSITARKVRVSKWTSPGCTIIAKHSHIVRRSDSAYTNCNKCSSHGSPDREVRQPAETLKRADLTHKHTEDSKDKQADDIAKAVPMNAVVANGDLGDGSTITKDKDSNQHEHLKTLQNVDNVSCCRAEDAEEGLSEIAEWVAIGIHMHEDTPDVPTRNRRHEAKNRVESDTRSVAGVGESPSKRKINPIHARRLGKLTSIITREWTVVRTLRSGDPEYQW